jgi:hypothetical protein
MIIAPFWENLYPFGSGTDNNVFWQVLGTPPPVNWLSSGAT